LEQERDFYLRSIRDLQAEHEAGDLADDDFELLRDAYTARAASVMRALEGSSGGVSFDLSGSNGSNGSKADRVAAGEPAHHPGRAAASGPSSWRRRIGAGIAATAVAGGACWTVVASSATRLPGDEITGKSLGSQAIAQQLSKAAQAESKGDQLSAIKDYQAILNADPNQPEALTGEGWLLAETQQPALLKQGLSMLTSAENVAPGYAPAHVYRGIALLSEGDYLGAVPELQWYLDHNPDPQLAPRVTQALKDAQAKAAQEGG
jgi:tetratricopeptide (TPR) repeat protein